MTFSLLFEQDPAELHRKHQKSKSKSDMLNNDDMSKKYLKSEIEKGELRNSTLNDDDVSGTVRNPTRLRLETPARTRTHQEQAPVFRTRQMHQEPPRYSYPPKHMPLDRSPLSYRTLSGHNRQLDRQLDRILKKPSLVTWFPSLFQLFQSFLSLFRLFLLF